MDELTRLVLRWYSIILNCFSHNQNGFSELCGNRGASHAAQVYSRWWFGPPQSILETTAGWQPHKRKRVQ